MVKLSTVTWIFVIISGIRTNVVHASNRLSVPMEAQGLEPPKSITITGDVATMTVTQLVAIVTSRDNHQYASIAAKKRHKLRASDCNFKDDESLSYESIINENSDLDVGILHEV
ncbi:Uncharacterized protein TCM_017066 [Theobroma cacao]|uniref:Uncharacterized protein n=1 Tax=Theobroma cacao TaxID=3641 RepID=A0A061EK56_THECC|nr:Uncharacterized protein TCM_017066 [Theobroma cacao]